MPMTIKVPVKKIKKMDVCRQVEDALMADRENAYTIAGLMVTVFGVKKSQIHNKPFKEWGEDKRVGKLPTLYSRIRKCLEKRVNDGLVFKEKVGKADLYWWHPKKTLNKIDTR